ncbi:MAG TPA: hypothetical protein VME43_19895 [Bryobacteraceae bacterium]|nr:hypothetical protein [Bryobacteraceae bacterium]
MPETELRATVPFRCGVVIGTGMMGPGIALTLARAQARFLASSGLAEARRG